MKCVKQQQKIYRMKLKRKQINGSPLVWTNVAIQANKIINSQIALMMTITFPSILPKLINILKKKKNVFCVLFVR